ncbi:CorA family divalent cation transporter [Yoonia sp. MH D7]
MADRTITPICAYDISTDGAVQPVGSSWAGIETVAAYRWLHFDLNDPAFTDWAESHLPRIAAKALLQSETRPRCDATPEGMLLNLRGVNLNPGADVEDMVSIRLWVADGLIVSTRKYKIFAVDTIRADIDAGKAPPNIAAFLAALAFALTKRIETVSLALEEDADELEEQAFSPIKQDLSKLPDLRLKLIKLRRFVRPQSEALMTLAAGDVWPHDEINTTYLRDTVNRNQRTIEELDATADRLSAIQEHLDMQAATSLGRNTYVLSIIAAIFLPLGFLTGLFGINVGGMPLIHSNFGFAVVAVGCTVIGIAVLLIFRALRWL